MALLGKKTARLPAGPTFVMPKINPLSDPRMRVLVRMAATEGNYEAMLDAHDLAMRLLPPGDELWSWWLGGLESLSASKDEDLAVFVKFTRGGSGYRALGQPPGGSPRAPASLWKLGRPASVASFQRLADAVRSECSQGCNHRPEAGAGGHNAHDGFVEALR